MKCRLLLIIGLSFFLCTLRAQEESKSNQEYIIGGSVDFFNQTNSLPFSSINTVPFGTFSGNSLPFSTNSFHVSSYIGKSINTHWMAAVYLQLGYSKRTTDDVRFTSGLIGSLITKENGSEFGLFVRYIFNPENKFRFYLQPNLGYASGKSSSTVDDTVLSSGDYKYVQIGTGVGSLYEVSQRFRLTLSIGGITYINGSNNSNSTLEKQNFSTLSSRLNLSSLRIGGELKF